MAAAAVQYGSQSLHDTIFASVFPPKDHSTPTPEVTPKIGVLASPSAPFGGFSIPDDPVDRATNFNRAWSSATRHLKLSSGIEAQNRDSRASPLAESAFHYLLGSDFTKKELLDWYNHEINTHFRLRVLPELDVWRKPIPLDQTLNVLSHTVQVLRQAQQLYLNIGLSTNPRGLKFIHEIKRDFHIILLHLLPRHRIQKTLANYLFQTMKSALQSSSDPERCLERSHCQCGLGLDMTTLAELHDVGLGGNEGERAFAFAMHKLLEGPGIERRCFQVDWNDKTSAMSRLRAWIDEVVVPSSEQALAALTGNPSLRLPAEQFESAAVGSFGRLRVGALFDYVSAWPASQGAVLDIREYLSDNRPNEKAYLCMNFSQQIQRRLLHAGASTSEILSMYINVINVFKTLDARGVLLEKVAIPIRNYLRLREDTSAIIASSLLADIGDSGEIHSYDHDKICPDIAVAIASSEVDAQDDTLLNWDDMQWVPDPIDAGPNYKASKSDDVVAYVLGLFDADDFIKALSASFGDHLVHTTETELIKETRLIELLKSRLDPTKLQHAEVMLKDIRDSSNLNRRINPLQHRHRRSRPTPKEVQAAIPNEGITIGSLYELFRDRMERQEFLAALQLVGKRRNDLYFPKRTRLPAEPESASSKAPVDIHFETKVLSSYFWPQLRDMSFRIPPLAKGKMRHYENAFANISGQRKLVWKHGLGMTDIKLELEDRVIEEDGVEVWKTSILDAFTQPPVPGDEALELSIEQLVDDLNMEEEYLISGVNYWISKRVLYEKSEGKFAVLERLDLDMQYFAESTEIEIEAISAVKSEDAMLRENAPMYETFIDGMLRNQGAKEIGGMMGITNILKMVMPTFTGGDNEVRWLLEDMEGKGAVKRNGEQWVVA